MQADVPKQFIAINSQPILVYTIAAFLKNEVLDFSEIVIVYHKDYFNELKNVLSTYFKSVKFILVEGGQSRFHSCHHGLKAINESDGKLVAVHDAARPLISQKLITTVFETASKHQSAIPVVKLKDSVRMLLNEENNSKIIDRNQLRLVQTPQCFNHSKLLRAYEKALESSDVTFTDDASVWEATFGNVKLCEGDLKNIKITTPFDLTLMKHTLKI